MRSPQPSPTKHLFRNGPGQAQHRQPLDAELTGRVITGAMQVRPIIGDGHTNE
jgi:hypothetical protein